MIVALLIQAAIVQAPALPPKDRQAELARRLACNSARVTPADATPRGILREPAGKAEKPLWRPGVNPDEGYYAAVARSIDGCSVPTPISLPFAPKSTLTR
jgi:hypothetical protein